MVSEDKLIRYAIENPGGFTVGDASSDLQWPLDLVVRLVDEALAEGTLVELLESPQGPVYVVDWSRVPVPRRDWPAY